MFAPKFFLAKCALASMQNWESFVKNATVNKFLNVIRHLQLEVGLQHVRHCGAAVIDNHDTADSARPRNQPVCPDTFMVTVSLNHDAYSNDVITSN